MEEGRESKTKGTSMVAGSPTLPPALECTVTLFVLSWAYCSLVWCPSSDRDLLVDSNYIQAILEFPVSCKMSDPE
jgi:hypothetical protein